MTHRKKKILICTVHALGVAAAIPAWAEQAPPESAAAETGATPRSAGAAEAAKVSSDDVTTVLVTSQRREQRIQEVPLAITAISGDTIEEQAITTSDALAAKVVNLQGQVSDQRGARPRWFLRGIGTNEPRFNVESPIGIYADDVYLGLVAVQGFPLFDQERVEVLRGPQGTLYGKNTTGGAINFISRKPKFDNDGYAKLAIGDWGTITQEGAVGGAIVDNVLAGRASVFLEKSDGYATNLFLQEEGPKYRDYAGRFQLFGVASENLDANLKLHFRSLSGGTVPTYPRPFRDDIVPGELTDNTGYVFPYGANLPEAGSDFYSGRTNPTTDQKGISANVNWRLNPGLSLASISAVDWVETTAYTTAGGWPSGSNPRNQGTSNNNNDYRQLFQELRLTSGVRNGLSWILGYNYFTSEIDYESYSITYFPQTAASFSNVTVLEEGTSHALFGNLRYAFTERLAVTAGLRWTDDERSSDQTRVRTTANGRVTFPNPADPTQYTLNDGVPEGTIEFTALKASNDWQEFTYDFAPEYRLTENALLFARYARGFRAGAFNPSISVDVSGEAYISGSDPEILDSYEIGIKTDWFDRRLTFNSTLFYYDVQDIQLMVQQPNPQGLPSVGVGSTLYNAAAAEIYGAEFEIEARPIRNLRINAGLGLLRGEYKDFFVGQRDPNNPDVFIPVDASGNKVYRAPETSFAVSVDYRVPLSSGSSLFFGTDWNYRSKIYFNAVVQDDPYQEQPGYALGNARAGWTTRTGQFSVTGFVNNITNEAYSIVTTAASAGANTARLGLPRYVGAAFTFKW